MTDLQCKTIQNLYGPNRPIDFLNSINHLLAWVWIIRYDTDTVTFGYDDHGQHKEITFHRSRIWVCPGYEYVQVLP